MKDILDEIEALERKLIWFDRDEKYTFAALWPVGTRLVNHYKRLTLFTQYPYLGFMSCDPDSGKSRALRVILRLSCNPELESEGVWTSASLLDAVYKNNNTILEDENGKQIIVDGVPLHKPFLTLAVEELDEVLVPGKDNTQLIQFFNLGYESGKTIRRKERFSKGEKTVHCFCPKLFSGLYTAKLKPTTRSRTALYSMLKKPPSSRVKRDLYAKDYAAMESIRLRLDAEYRQFIPLLEKMAVPDEDLDEDIIVLPDVEDFDNRDLQLVKGVLGIAYLAKSQWYEKALLSAKFFFGGQNRELTQAQQIIRAMLRIYLSGEYLKGIHTGALISELVDEHGFNKRDLDENKISDALTGYDEANHPRGIRLPVPGFVEDKNRNGYYWKNCFKTWNHCIPPNIIDEILADVDTVEDVGNARLHREQFLEARKEYTGARVGVEVSTGSTGSTENTNKKEDKMAEKYPDTILDELVAEKNGGVVTFQDYQLRRKERGMSYHASAFDPEAFDQKEACPF